MDLFAITKKVLVGYDFGVEDNDSIVRIDDVKTIEVISKQIKVKMDLTPEVILKARMWKARSG